MGSDVFDKYSLLHFATGIIAYFWGVSFSTWMIIHIIFEYIENTQVGMRFINDYFKLWPGGKQKADTFTNSMIGDNISAAMGWLLPHILDKNLKY